jgi:preprotein translocase subunit SecG
LFLTATAVHRIAMKNSVIIAQIVVSVLMTVAILMQSRGSGLGAAFGGDGNVYRTKRGVEKVLYRATIVLAVAFVALALAIISLPQE